MKPDRHTYDNECKPGEEKRQAGVWEGNSDWKHNRVKGDLQIVETDRERGESNQVLQNKPYFQFCFFF